MTHTGQTAAPGAAWPAARPETVLATADNRPRSPPSYGSILPSAAERMEGSPYVFLCLTVSPKAHTQNQLRFKMTVCEYFKCYWKHHTGFYLHKTKIYFNLLTKIEEQRTPNIFGDTFYSVLWIGSVQKILGRSKKVGECYCLAKGIVHLTFVCFFNLGYV